jgi:hypothetical protein
MLCGLRQSPRHWYANIKTIFVSLGLRDNALDPYLFTGTIVNPSNPAVPPSTAPLTFGLYADNSIYFSEDLEVKRLFKQLLAELVTVEFMGTLDWFLGTHFQWLSSNNKVSVHQSQTGFAAHLVKENNAYPRNITPDATPNCSGLPIDAIPDPDKDDNAQPSSNASIVIKVLLV